MVAPTDVATLLNETARAYLGTRITSDPASNAAWKKRRKELDPETASLLALIERHTIPSDVLLALASRDEFWKFAEFWIKSDSPATLKFAAFAWETGVFYKSELLQERSLGLLVSSTVALACEFPEFHSDMKVAIREALPPDERVNLGILIIRSRNPSIPGNIEAIREAVAAVEAGCIAASRKAVESAIARLHFAISFSPVQEANVAMEKLREKLLVRFNQRT